MPLKSLTKLRNVTNWRNQTATVLLAVWDATWRCLSTGAHRHCDTI